jgi:hypothetical protein
MTTIHAEFARRWAEANATAAARQREILGIETDEPTDLEEKRETMNNSQIRAATESPNHSTSESMRAALEAVAEMRAARAGDFGAAGRMREAVETSRMNQFTSTEREALATLGTSDPREVAFLVELRALVKEKKCAAEGTPVFEFNPEGDAALEVLQRKQERTLSRARAEAQGNGFGL